MSDLALFAVWLTLVVLACAVWFYLGAMSQKWGGWDYLLYGKPFSESTDDRISLVQFADLAKAKGWTGESALVFDLAEGLADAIATRQVTLYGIKDVANRDRKDWYKYNHFAVEQDHLIDYQLETFGAFYFGENADSRTAKRDDTRVSGYVDLMVHRWQALKWLKVDGDRWMGRHDQRQEEARQRRERWEAEMRDQGFVYLEDEGDPEQGGRWVQVPGSVEGASHAEEP